jgi:hypothetical protein
MFTLAEYGSAIAMDTSFWFQAVDDETYPLRQLGDLTLTLEKSLRALANISLLVHHDVGRFKDNLRQAASVRLKYLARVHEKERYDEHHFATGRYAHIVDAIAGGHMGLAQNIYQQSPKELSRGKEYPDDFCFGALLGEWVQPHVNYQRLDALIADFGAYLSGDDDPRFVIMEAFQKRDNDQFEEGMSDLMVLHEQSNVDAREKGIHLDAAEIALQRVSIDGICLLNIARNMGLEIQTTYKYCPSV